MFFLPKPIYKLITHLYIFEINMLFTGAHFHFIYMYTKTNYEFIKMLSILNNYINQDNNRGLIELEYNC